MPSRIELLQAMPVFGGLREETLSFLLDLSNMVSVAAGGYFFRQDDEAEAMYVLEAGRASVLKGWKGHQYVLSHLGQGDCFGEMSLMDMHHRSASVVADEPCEAIELTSGSLLAIYERDLEQFTLIQMNMGREVSRRLRDADERLFHAKIRSAEVLAEYRFRTI
jgi:CRP/FNR family cyclic AMP-dependent transcriptional regulator